jgi:basic membrane protein A
MKRVLIKLLSLLSVFVLVAAACGGDDDDSSSGNSSETSSDSSSSSSSEGAAEEAASSGDLATCPDPLVIQTDWFPESEHGAMYELFGSGAYSIDAENLIVSGTLHDGATDTGIGLEVRTGGPAIGFSPVASYMYTDSNITLGYANTEAQVTFFESAPLLSVVAPLEKNPQMVMWDPETYPNVNTLKDLGDEGITISVFAGGVFAEVFIAQGIWSQGQVDPSYDGGPANFIANGGSIAQQGFASAEPYDYENVFTDWGKPVKLQLLHDAGFPVYSQTIAIRSDEKDALDECLKALVPVIQRATVSFVTSPDTANGIIIDAVDTFGSFWVYSEGLADFSVNAQKQLGLVGNGPNDTVGDMEEDRVQNIIDIMSTAGIETGGITTADIYTNEYIDPSIGFTGDDLCVDEIGVSIGLVYDIGGRGDQSFNDSAYEGIARAECSLGISFTEASPNDDGSNRAELLQLAADSSDLVIGVGFLFAGDAEAVAAVNPDTNFAVVDSAMINFDTGGPIADNIAGLTFAEQEGSFLVGAAAALKTGVDKIGFIGGVCCYGGIEPFEAGYIAGAKAVNPNIEILSQYVTDAPDFDGFNAPDRGKEIALAMFEDGADIVYHAAGGTGAGLFQAALEHSESEGSKVWAIGVDYDQYNVVDDALKPHVLSSMLKEVGSGIYLAVQSHITDSWSAGQVTYSLENGGVGYATSGGYVDDIVSQLEAFKSQIENGDIVVSRNPLDY